MSLYGSTVLLPQYLQVWMGYSATNAGMVLSPGALVFVCLMPIIGRLLSRYDARYLIAFGFSVLTIALYHMSRTLYPGIDFSTAVWMRIYVTTGLAFLFVPINTVVYAGVAPSKNNAVAGIVNLSRNMGGDIGIALVTTLIARRAQVHQEHIATAVAGSAQTFAARLSGIAQAFERAGMSSVQATKSAYAAIYRQVIQQAQTLAYLDTLFVFACFAALMVPLVLLTKSAQGRAAASH